MFRSTSIKSRLRVKASAELSVVASFKFGWNRLFRVISRVGLHMAYSTSPKRLQSRKGACSRLEVRDLPTTNIESQMITIR